MDILRTFQIKKTLIYITFCLMAEQQCFSMNLTIPYLSLGKTGYTNIVYVPQTCGDIFNTLSIKDTDYLKKIINFANSHFKRRGWSEEFLNERLLIAEKYDSRSEYYTVTDNQSNKIVATLGATFATYSPIKNKKIELLPLEEILNLELLPRPKNHNGEGVVVELRAYSIEPSVHNDVYTEIVSMLLTNLFSRIKNIPELYKQPILYTYGDEVSLKLYGMMGFKKLNTQPIKYKGSNWWVMSTTPEIIEKLVKRISKPSIISNFNQVIQFKLPNGHSANLKVNSTVINNELLKKQNSNLLQIITHLNEPTEVTNGIWADTNSSVSWYENGQIASISKLYKQTKTSNNLIADSGSSIAWNIDGKVIKIGKIAEDAVVSQNIIAAKGSTVEWYDDGMTLNYISKLAQSALVEKDIFAAKGAKVFWRLPNAHLSYISELENNTFVGNNIIAAKGSEIYWTYDWDLKSAIVESVSEITNLCEVAKDVWAAPGSSFHVSLDPTKTPSVSILGKDLKTKSKFYKTGDFLPFHSEY